MAGREFRIGIVGASSLAGKELSDSLADSTLAACDITLLDQDDVAGQMTTAGDEVSFIQKIEPESFVGLDFVFFAGDPATTLKYWKTARTGRGQPHRYDRCAGGRARGRSARSMGRSLRGNAGERKNQP